jgi:hypothetical protein
VLSWPPPWDPAVAPADGHDAPAPARAVRAYPPPGWPSKEQLEYTQRLFAVIIIGLALPWLVKHLLTEPGRVIAGAARQQIKTPPR